MLFESPPTYNDPDCEFTTDFESVSGPGFFPVHSGRVVADDLSQQTRCATNCCTAVPPNAGRVNRPQVGGRRPDHGGLMPCFIKVMIDNPETDWGLPRYPVRPDPFPRRPNQVG